MTGCLAFILTPTRRNRLAQFPRNSATSAIPMSAYPMTETIARREYLYEGPGGTGQIVVEIGTPVPFPDASHGDWYCPFRIDGMGQRREGSMAGVDALQALLLAISAVKVHLQLISKGAKLTWLDGNDLGISLSASDDTAGI